MPTSKNNSISCDSINHQVNTSLFFLQWYMSQYEGNPSKKNKEAIEKEMAHLKKILNQFENIPNTQEPINLLDVLKNVSEVFTQENKSHSLYLQATNVRLIHSNLFYCEELIRILLENAFKHSPKGNSIYCDLFEEEHSLKLSIKNNGIGLDPQVQKNIWNPYYQSSQSTKSSGLGLYIAKNIAEKNNCEVQCESDHKSYITFSILFPLT